MPAGEVGTSRVFVVRLSTAVEPATLRGHVRDGLTGAYRAFTAWNELTAFLADQLDQDVGREADRTSREALQINEAIQINNEAIQINEEKP
jgi:hypothetical protein